MHTLKVVTAAKVNAQKGQMNKPTEFSNTYISANISARYRKENRVYKQ